MASRNPNRVMLRVVKGALQPADDYAIQTLRQRGFHVGDIVSGDIRKPRNPGFHRLAHQLGTVIAQNIDAFHGMSAHDTLKAIQLEADIACESVAVGAREAWKHLTAALMEATGTESLRPAFDTIGALIPNIRVNWRTPRSLSYSSMDEGEFREVVTAICRYVSSRYWQSCTPDQIERMAELYVEAA